MEATYRVICKDHIQATIMPLCTPNTLSIIRPLTLNTYLQAIFLHHISSFTIWQFLSTLQEYSVPKPIRSNKRLKSKP